jgi:hypothetical protein
MQRTALRSTAAGARRWAPSVAHDELKGKDMFKHYLMHDRLLIRFGALLGIVAAIFFGTWLLSYWFIPEGVLRGRTGAQLLAGSDLLGDSVWLEWLRILAINLGVMFLLMIAPNLIRNEVGYPLGYGTVTVIAVIYAVTLGTNSFTLSLGGKLPPTVSVLGRSGPYEIAAYVLAATATISVSKYRLAGKWPKQTLEALLPPQAKSVLRESYVGLILAIALLIIASGWEAYRISQAIASVP